MRRPFVAGNWKMHGSLHSAAALVDGIVAGMGSLSRVQAAVCPPYVYLSAVSERLRSTPLELGAQNVSEQESGPFTGEVSTSMLRDVGCQYVIVGHSERRALYQESDQRVAEKFVRAQQADLTPIACFGETLVEREAGDTHAVVGRQLDAVLDACGAGALASSVIAYEPVWAIGTGKTASPEQANDVHAFIRRRIAAADSAVADQVRILYGGSVKADNAAELFAQVDIDGGLIGGASLKADDFLDILQAAD